MKIRLVSSARRDFVLLSTGTKNAVRCLFRWVNSAESRDVLKKRLIITLCVPAGLGIAATQYPAVVAGASLAAFLLTSFWFGYQKPRTMSFHAEDFVRPFLLQGRTVDLVDLVRHLAAEEAGGGLQEVTRRIREEFGGPSITVSQLSSLMARHAVQVTSVPSPPEPQEVKEEENVEEETTLREADLANTAMNDDRTDMDEEAVVLVEAEVVEDVKSDRET